MSTIHTIDPVSLLPFIGREEHHPNWDFWHIRPSGNYGDECRLGEAYARECVDYLRQYQDMFLLGWIVRDMMRHNRKTGLEIGFMYGVSQAVVGL